MRFCSRASKAASTSAKSCERKAARSLRDSTQRHDPSTFTAARWIADPGKPLPLLGGATMTLARFLPIILVLAVAVWKLPGGGTASVIALRPHRDRYGYHALASGGIGWGLPASVGVSMANPDRPVVCFSGDGSAMYSIQALWTAAHHKLPLTVVIINNGGYRIIKQRLLAFHGDDHYVGMDFVDPKVDFTGLAKSFGLEAMRITEAKDLRSVLASAFSRPGAKLIEVVVDGTV